jgi:hypothetical protein
LSGTTNYLAKFTSTTGAGNSQLFDNGTNVGIGTASPSHRLTVSQDAADARVRIVNPGPTVGYQSTLELTGLTGGTYGGLFQYNYNTEVLYIQNYGRSNLSDRGSINFQVKVADTALATVGLFYGNTGFFGLNVANPLARLHADTGAATNKGIIVKGFTSQSANLQEWHNSSGTANSWIDSSGSEFNTNGVNLTSYTSSYIKFSTSGHGLYRNNSWMGVGSYLFDGFFIESSNSGRPNIRSAYPAGNGDKAIVFNTTTSLASALSRIATFENNGTIGAYILRDGDGVFSGVRVGVGPGTTSYNTVCGAGAWANNTTGTYSTAVGYNALTANTTGGVNTAIGSFALQSNTTGVYNTAVGYSALGSVTTQNNNVAVGRAAISGSTGSNNTAIGSDAALALTTGGSNVLAGYAVAQALTTGSSNVVLGVNCLTYTTTSSGNVAIGYEAARLQADGATALAAGNYNVYIGYNVKGFNNSDTNAIVVGYNAIGKGANTAVIGNTSTTQAWIYGTGIIYNSTGSNYNENLRLPESSSGYSVINMCGAAAD